MGKVIHWELCKRLNLELTTKWYNHKPESVHENEMHKIFLDFEIEKDNLNLAKRLDLMIINKNKKKSKKECLSSRGFCRISGPQSENQRKQKRETNI